MQFSEDAIKRLIIAIGYTPQDGKNGIYLKSIQIMVDIVFFWTLIAKKSFTIPMKSS